MNSFSDQVAIKTLKQKSRQRKKNFPAATIAYYGSNADLATKVAVGIISKNNHVIDMKKWFSENDDIRMDNKVHKEILAFIKSKDVRSVVMTEKIIGCPHEEGIDYPEGSTCPKCPYWTNRDRWTGELLKPQ